MRNRAINHSTFPAGKSRKAIAAHLLGQLDDFRLEVDTQTKDLPLAWQPLPCDHEDLARHVQLPVLDLQ